MMKKTLLSVFVVMLMFGCGTATDKDNGDSDQNKEGEVRVPKDKFTNDYSTTLLEDVEASDIFFHEKIAFTSIEFSVRDSLSYSAGKDIYVIYYVSSAEPEDTVEAYIDYLDVVTDEFSNEYALDVEGTVNELPVYVQANLDYDKVLGGYIVYIRISEKPAKFQEDNRYFNEYPDLVDFYESTLEGLFHREITYTESYTDNVKTYYITFLSTANEDDFTTFYTDNYSQKPDFEIEEDNNQRIFNWSDTGYEHIVRYTKSNDTHGVGVIVKTLLP